jgi:hypothetical protein
MPLLADSAAPLHERRFLPTLSPVRKWSARAAAVATALGVVPPPRPPYEAPSYSPAARPRRHRGFVRRPRRGNNSKRSCNCRGASGPFPVGLRLSPPPLKENGLTGERVGRNRRSWSGAAESARRGMLCCWRVRRGFVRRPRRGNNSKRSCNCRGASGPFPESREESPLVERGRRVGEEGHAGAPADSWTRLHPS